MQMKLELVPIPVSEVDRAKAFYAEKLGFNVDHDTSPPGSGIRLVQLTPSGSACSILIQKGLPDIDIMQPGSLRALHLVVADVAKARELLISAGIETGEITDHGRGVKSVGFSDPDGNSWLFQEMAWRSADFED